MRALISEFTENIVTNTYSEYRKNYINQMKNENVFKYFEII